MPKSTKGPQAILLHKWEVHRGPQGLYDDLEVIVDTVYPVAKIRKVEATDDYKARMWEPATGGRTDAKFRSRVYLSKDEYDWVTETPQEILALINGE